MKSSSIRVLRESLPTPDWAVQRLTLAGGLNRFDGPNYRVVWSENRLAFVGGKFEDRDAEGNLIREVLDLRTMPKYPVFNRWIVEQWLPPEKYGTPEGWLRQTKEWGEEGNVPQLGPFPTRGDYEMACVLDEGGNFIPLTPTILNDVILAIKVTRKKKYAESVRERKQLAEDKKRKDVEFSHQYLNEHTMPVANDGMMVTVL